MHLIKKMLPMCFLLTRLRMSRIPVIVWLELLLRRNGNIPIPLSVKFEPDSVKACGIKPRTPVWALGAGYMRRRTKPI